MQLSFSLRWVTRVRFLHLLGCLVVARLVFLGAGLYAGTVFPVGTSPNSQQYVVVPIPASADVLAIVRKLHKSADEGWYFSVASQGYTARPFDLSRQENWSMSPLMPIIWKLVGLNVIVLLILIYAANVGALYFLWRICLDVLNLGARRSQFVCLCFIFWPFGYQLFLTRAEPFQVMLTFAALYYYSRGRGWRDFGIMLVCIFFATSAKPNGFICGAALIATECLIQLRDRRYGWLSSTLWLRLVLLSLATFLPLVLLSIAMYVNTGNPLAWIDIQATWAAPPQPSIDSAIAAFVPRAIVARWGWDATLLNSALLYFSVAVLIYFTINQWRNEIYWPLLIGSLMIQLISGALFFAYVFDRHSLPILLNYLGAGGTKALARTSVVFGAGFQALAGCLGALNVIHILA